MPLTLESRVGHLATEHPLATRVFARHGLDYCCGGGRTLQDACVARGLDPDQVLDEIRREVTPVPAPESRWSRAPLDELIGHIVTVYHQPLREELPRLEAMARKVLDVHGDKDPDRLCELLEVYLRLRRELEEHMEKEEEVLFPLIAAGYTRAARDTMVALEDEHDRAGAALRRLRSLTDDYHAPPGACNTWRALWYGLGTLEQSMHIHIHLENNILFPRALEG